MSDEARVVRLLGMWREDLGVPVFKAMAETALSTLLS